jgi:hypothetical protein
VPVLPTSPSPGLRPANLSTDAILERLTVFLVSASGVGLALAVAGLFVVPLVLASASLCTWVYHLRVPGRDVPASGPPRMLHVVPVLLVALCFRLAPFDFVMGGQDHGAYTNIASELLATHDIAVVDAERERLASSSALAAYMHDNYIDPFLPGVYATEDSSQRLVFQFYHLFPVWLALFAGTFGAASGTYGLTFLALVSVVFFQRLAGLLTGSARLGAAAGLLLAVNPLHAFFSRFPVTEVPTLAFSAVGFSFLCRYAGAAAVERRNQWLWLSALAFGCLFLTRISGFMYLPLVLAIGVVPFVLDEDRQRALGLARWALGTALLYAASVGYGLTFSHAYSARIYEDSFSRIAGQHWSLLPMMLALVAVVAWSSVLTRPHGWVGRTVAWLVPRLSRWMGVALIVVLVAGACKVYAMAFTDAYSTPPLARPFTPFPGLAAAGWRSVAHSSLVASSIYLCPLLFIAALVITQLRLVASARFLVFFLLCFTAYLALLNWVLPYQPYYGRYLASEFVPYMLLLAVCSVAWIERQAGRNLMVGMLAVSGAYFVVLSAGQLGKQENEFARESIARLAAVADDGDLILLDDQAGVDFTPREIKTTLVYTFGRHVISAGHARWSDAGYLEALDAAYDDVFLATRVDFEPPGFERAGAFRLRAIDFARSAGPPWRMRAALDQNVFVFRLARSSHDVGGRQTFMVASDDRIQTQVGVRDPSRGIVAAGRAGVLVYGPYVPLPAGVYQAQVWASEPGGGTAKARMDVVHGQGAHVLVAMDGRAPAGDEPAPMGTLEFEVPASGVTDLEIRVAVEAGSRLAVSRLILTRLR